MIRLIGLIVAVPLLSAEMGRYSPPVLHAAELPAATNQGAAENPAATALDQTALDQTPLEEAIRQAILDELKQKYEDSDNWGHTTSALKGVKIKGKWFKPRIEKVTTPVKNGLWQRYIVTLIEPDKNLHLRLGNVHASESGRIAFSLLLEAKLRGEAHIERWRLGTKTFNVSALADAIVEARIDCDVAIRFEPGKLLSDVVLDPRVTAVHLKLIDLDLKRLSKIGGDPVHELGDSITPLVGRELDRREPKIVAKANAAIDKRRNRLRFSFDEFLKSGWSKLQTTMAAAPPTTKLQK
jgi:hypothetical protein